MDKGSSVADKTVESLKAQLWKSLMDNIIDAMLHGTATLKDGKESAQFMLDKLDNINTKPELLQFLFDLQTKWKIYNPVYVKVKYTLEGDKDTQKIEELRSKLYTFIQPS